VTDLSSLPEILKALNDLRAWGALVLAFLSCLGLAGFSLWLWYRHQDSVIGGKAKAVDSKALLEAARLEQDGKDRRARIYASAVSDLRKSIDTMQESVRRHDENNTAKSEAFSAALAQQMVALQALLSSVRGILNAQDSLKLVEDYFLGVLAAEFVRVSSASITRNNYQKDKDFIRVRFCAAMTEVTEKVRTALAGYPMVLRADVFFPSTGGDFDLVLHAWDIVRQAHEARYAAGTVHDAEATVQAAEQVGVLVRKAVAAHFSACRVKALDIYHG
jgi:hypothetical protein